MEYANYFGFFGLVVALVYISYRYINSMMTGDTAPTNGYEVIKGYEDEAYYVINWENGDSHGPYKRKQDAKGVMTRLIKERTAAG